MLPAELSKNKNASKPGERHILWFIAAHETVIPGIASFKFKEKENISATMYKNKNNGCAHPKHLKRTPGLLNFFPKLGSTVKK